MVAPSYKLYYKEGFKKYTHLLKTVITDSKKQKQNGIIGLEIYLVYRYSLLFFRWYTGAWDLSGIPVYVDVILRKLLLKDRLWSKNKLSND